MSLGLLHTQLKSSMSSFTPTTTSGVDHVSPPPPTTAKQQQQQQPSSKGDILTAILQKPCTLQILTLLQRLTFGSPEMKDIVSQSAATLHVTGYIGKVLANERARREAQGAEGVMVKLTVEEAEVSTAKSAEAKTITVAYLQCLKAFVVNSKKGRGNCNNGEVFGAFAQVFHLYGDADEGILAEAVTCLCAVCMNDSVNQGFAKETVGVEVLKRLTAGKPETDETVKKVAFLEALLG